MQLSEKEVEDFVFDDLKQGGHDCRYRGLRIASLFIDNENYVRVLWTRQLNLDPYGIADIVGFYRHGGMLHVDLIELKAREIKPEDFEQISRYRKGIEVYLRNTFKGHVSINFNLYLIGTSYEAHFLQNITPIHVGSYKYSVAGMQFKIHDPYSGWHITSGQHKSFSRTKLLQLNGEKVL